MANGAANIGGLYNPLGYLSRGTFLCRGKSAPVLLNRHG